MAAVNHEARYYMLRKARYPASRAEDMRRREVELARSTAWVLARNEAAANPTVLLHLLGIVVNVMNPQKMSYSAVTDGGLILCCCC